MNYWPLATAMLGSALVRAALQPIEWTLERCRRRSTPPIEDPVFIVGHWRSGTTHLHNLLGRSPLFGHISPLAAGLPDELFTLVAWLRPHLERALPEDRYVDRVAVTPESPQEDEIPLASQQRLSVFHALYFPGRFRERFRRGVFLEGATQQEIERWARCHRQLLERVALEQSQSRLLIKNPVYTARLEQLRRIWPTAQFIHIRRNPYTVYASTLHYYRRLLAELALQPYDHIDLEELILETYVEMMARYDAAAAQMPRGQLTEVAFEDLESDPLGVLREIHEVFALEEFDLTRTRVDDYLEGIRGYRKNELSLSRAQAEAVGRRWSRYLERWSYGASEVVSRTSP